MAKQKQICTFIGTVKNLSRFLKTLEQLDKRGEVISQAGRKYFNDKPFETKIDFCA